MLPFVAYILPVLLCVAYAFTLPLVPPQHRVWFNEEFGPVEILSALMFLAIGVAAAHLVWKLRRRRDGRARQGPPGTQPASVPRLWLIWYALFALGGVFVFLEETSYGQHLFGWQAPQYFLEHAKQPETNLHNLHGDLLSRLMRRVAEIGFPIAGLIVPAIFVFARLPYRRGEWPFYALPRLELAVWLIAAALMRPMRNWTGLTSVSEWRGSLSEFQELLWAGALLTYVVVMNRRLLTPPSADELESLPCAGCGYDLRGTAAVGGAVCPECGAAFEPPPASARG